MFTINIPLESHCEVGKNNVALSVVLCTGIQCTPAVLALLRDGSGNLLVLPEQQRRLLTACGYVLCDLLHETDGKGHQISGIHKSGGTNHQFLLEG